jgi:macrodomain Ter protein organizer (MatP/YcbG family)
MARKPTDTVQLKLRFPEALRRRLVREAKRRGESLNGYIVRVLEEAFQQSDDVQQRAQAIAEALGDQIVNAIVEQARKEEAEDQLADHQREREEDFQREREGK